MTDVFSTGTAFAALKADGSVVTWGDSTRGGDSSPVADQLSGGVTDMFSAVRAFAALKADGSVLTWGDNFKGGDSSAVADQLSSGVTDVFSARHAFAALKTDGSVVTWGESRWGGNSSAVADQLSGGVTDVFSAVDAFAALKADGSVVTWGDSTRGGDSSAVADQLSGGVTDVFTAGSAFAALKADGSVVTWGDSTRGGDSSAVADQLSGGVTDVFSARHAFAALKADGSVVTWGESRWGGDSSAVADQLSGGVTDIFSASSAFAALKADGSVVTWGDNGGGGYSSAVVDQLSGGVTDVFSAVNAFAALKADGSLVTWGDRNGGGDSSAVADQTSAGVVGLASPFADQQMPEIAPGDGDDEGGGPDAPGDGDGDDTPPVEVGDDVEIDTSPLSVSALGGWVDDGAGARTNASGSDVFLGHAEGATALLRVENGTVGVSSSGRVTVDGDVYAVRGAQDRPLFSGSFNIEPGALAATDFTPQLSGYGLLNDLVAINFSQLSFSEDKVSLGADLDFPTPFNALDTSGGPLTLRYGADGLSFGPGRVGTSDWLPDFNLPLSAGTPVDLSFSDLGVDYDGLDDSLYLSGTATLGWGGTLADQFGTLGVPAQELKLDLAGDRTGDALFQRGDKFIRLRPDGDELAFDVVGDIGYASEAGFLREMSLGLDTIEQSFSGRVTGALGFSDSRTLTGELSGFWDPVAIDSVSFGLSGLNYPVATTGLFLQGGALGVDGLASPGSGGSGERSYSGQVDYTYGSAAGGVPTPIRGDIGGSFSADSVAGSFSIRSTPEYILGDSTSGGILDVMDRFGVDASAALDFEILDASGSIEANFANKSLNAELDASILGGLYTGSADLAMFEDAGVRTLEFGARGAVEFPETLPLLGPLIGGRSLAGNVALEYSADGNFSNDFIAAWTTIDFGLSEIKKGLQFSFDGDFSALNTKAVEKIASWELGPEMEIAVMSAEWETPRADAELIVITPDGTRLSEADIVAREDIAIAPGLTTDTSRHVALETPEAGIWDIEMVSPDGLGEVTYSASDIRSGPTLDFAVAADDREAELAEFTLIAQGLTAGSDIILKALANRDDAAGVRLEVEALQSEDGSQTVTWDYSDFDPGIYHLEAVARGGGVAPEGAVTETTITVDALISGTITGSGGAPLSDTALRFSVDGTEKAVTQTDELGNFTLRAPPETAGQISLERSVTADDMADITASDALETLRLAVGLDPSWGPADGADLVAADFNGDGRVTASDALDILRIAVGLDTGDNQPRWVFGDIETEGMNAGNVRNLDNHVDIAALTADTQINAQGILVGNMENYA
ncbi:hypothetical protein ACROSR_19030 [Roseovarius tibetensis]|uniref:hypothetical protein n=1 Tax=Roseovarius tibetensis TaxID=2685897 RepID=UPI003D7F65B9